ncbi:MAG: hypothetical protein IKQ31_04520 [Clostridia bacterium]|nr:hypothetical protein [Clostridia bacterium]
MKTNLVYFSNCTPQQKMAIHKFLPSFTYGTFSSIVSKTELVTFADVGDIKNALTSSSIIALDFSDDALFRKVQSALSQYYHTSVKNTDFGGFCKGNSNQFCSVVNIGKEPYLEVETLQSLYDTQNPSCYKLWGISAVDLMQQCSEINGFNFKSYVLSEYFGDLYLLIQDDDDDFKQELYQYLGNYIYIEKFCTPLESVAEIEGIRKHPFGVMDFIGGEITNTLLSDEQLKPYVTNLENWGINKTTTLEEIKKLVFARQLSFALLVLPSKDGIKVIFIDDDIHPFTIKNESEFGSMEYLKNFVCIKIFNKLRKNTFLY